MIGSATSTWRTMEATAVGTSHGASGTPCQDRTATRLSTFAGTNVVVLAIADGAGTASRAEDGAARATRDAVAFVQRRLDEYGEEAPSTQIAAEAIAAARKSVIEYAQAHNVEAREMACTLIVVVADDSRTTVAHVGDGGVVGRRNGRIEVLSWPRQREYANVTDFITDDKAHENVRCIETGAVDALAAFSDGLQGLALDYASQTAFEPFFEPFFRYLARTDNEKDERDGRVADFLQSATVNDRTDDDKALIVAIRET